MKNCVLINQGTHSENKVYILYFVYFKHATKYKKCTEYVLPLKVNLLFLLFISHQFTFEE